MTQPDPVRITHAPERKSRGLDDPRAHSKTLLVKTHVNHRRLYHKHLRDEIVAAGLSDRVKATYPGLLRPAGPHPRTNHGDKAQSEKNDRESHFGPRHTSPFCLTLPLSRGGRMSPVPPPRTCRLPAAAAGSWAASLPTRKWDLLCHRLRAPFAFQPNRKLNRLTAGPVKPEPSVVAAICVHYADLRASIQQRLRRRLGSNVQSQTFSKTPRLAHDDY